MYAPPGRTVSGQTSQAADRGPLTPGMRGPPGRCPDSAGLSNGAPFPKNIPLGRFPFDPAC